MLLSAKSGTLPVQAPNLSLSLQTGHIKTLASKFEDSNLAHVSFLAAGMNY